MSSSYIHKLEELERAVLSSKGSLTPALRRQILERARNGARDGGGTGPRLPEWIESLADAVVESPSTAGVDAYLEQGKSETEIFEVVTVAAVGVAMARADRVVVLLRKKP
jgi:hypothetical protein